MNMPIEFIVRGGSTDSTDALREYAIRRISFAVRRFGHRVRDVTVRLVDVNGPRRGVDSRSTVTANLVDGGHLIVEATSAWPFAAITVAAGRLREALRRDTARHTAARGEPADTPQHGSKAQLRVP